MQESPYGIRSLLVRKSDVQNAAGAIEGRWILDDAAGRESRRAGVGHRLDRVWTSEGTSRRGSEYGHTTHDEHAHFHGVSFLVRPKS
jgi:hypothetical protein